MGRAWRPGSGLAPLPGLQLAMLSWILLHDFKTREEGPLCCSPRADGRLKRRDQSESLSNSSLQGGLMPTSLSATRPDAKARAWPALPLDEWRDPYTTHHPCTQGAGTSGLAQAPTS